MEYVVCVKVMESVVVVGIMDVVYVNVLCDFIGWEVKGLEVVIGFNVNWVVVLELGSV